MTVVFASPVAATMSRTAINGRSSVSRDRMSSARWMLRTPWLSDVSSPAVLRLVADGTVTHSLSSAAERGRWCRGHHRFCRPQSDVIGS
jgi:hypothetical protein